MESISIDDFKKVEARIGKVLVAEAVPDSDKLIRFEIDFGGDNGGERRQILSAIREWYTEPATLVGKSMLFVTNLAPRTIRGLASDGMLMAVSDSDGKPIFLIPEHDVPNGSLVR